MAKKHTPITTSAEIFGPGAGSSSYVLRPVAIFEFQDEKSLSESRPQVENDATPWYKWGEDNLLPQHITDAIYENDVLPSNIETSQNLIAGGGLTYWLKTRTAEGEGKDFTAIPEVDEFFQNLDADYMADRMMNLEHSFNSPTEFILNDEDNPKVVNLKTHDVITVRSGFPKASTGEVEKFYLCGNWRKPVWYKDDEVKGNVVSVDAFNSYLSSQCKKFIRWSKYKIPGQVIYSFPSWWYAIKNWLSLSKEISRFQLANINNGMNVKFHVKVPISIFAHCNTFEEKEKWKEKVQAQIEENLLGAKNAGKTWSSFTVNVNGQQMEGVEIIPINYDPKDDTFMKTFEVSTRAISRASYVHPTLAGLDFSGNLGSGSEVRSLYNYHVGVKAIKRRDVALSDLYIVKKINGWPANLEFGFNLVTLVTTDNSASGTKAAIS